MPELPEVEVMTQNLRRWTENQHITLHLLDSKILKSDGTDTVSGLAGVTYRRGKYTILPVGKMRVLFHYRMTGKLVLGAQRKHSRALIMVNGVDSIWFVDVRRFGGIWFIPDTELNAFWTNKGIGPEIYPNNHDGEWWKNRFRGIKAPIKNALLRQGCVAGLGNICASEICYRAQVAPSQPTNQLTDAEWTAYRQHLLFVRLLRKKRPWDHCDFRWHSTIGIWVYGCAGAMSMWPAIRRFVQAGRATFIVIIARQCIRLNLCSVDFFYMMTDRNLSLGDHNVSRSQYFLLEPNLTATVTVRLSAWLIHMQ